MQPIIVEAAETWPAVIAGLISGLGAAVIIAFVTLKVTRKQRENDTTLAQQQRGADAERTQKQLGRDRDMRDLQYLRGTLPSRSRNTPSAGKPSHRCTSSLIRPRIVSSRSGERPSGGRWIRSERRRKGSDETRRVLVILLGPEAEVSQWLGELADDGSALIHIARERVEAKRTRPEIRAAIDDIWTKYGFDQARFIEHANKDHGPSDLSPVQKRVALAGSLVFGLAGHVLGHDAVRTEVRLHRGQHQLVTAGTHEVDLVAVPSPASTPSTNKGSSPR